MKFKRFLSLVLAVVMVFSLAACSKGGDTTAQPATGTTGTTSQPSSGTAKYVLKAAHVLAPDHPYNLGLVKMADLLKEKSNGQVQLDVFPASQLGGERDLIEGMQLGTVDMAVVSTAPIANFAETFYVFDLPYLFTDYDTTYEVLDGQIGEDLLKSLETQGIIGMNFWENGFFNMITKDSVVKPEDMNGMKIRAFENPLHQSIFKNVGANPVPMPWGEVYTAVQNGTVDGCTTSIGVTATSKLEEVAKNIAMTGHVYAAAPLLMSKMTWDGLPADIQKMITECADESRDYMRKITAESRPAQIDQLKAAGVTVSEVDKDAWKKATAPVYTEFVGSKISADLVDSIKAITQKK